MPKDYNTLINERLEDMERLASLTLRNRNIATMAEMGADVLKAKAKTYAVGSGEHTMYRLLGAAAAMNATNLVQEALRTRQRSKIAILNFNLDFPDSRI